MQRGGRRRDGERTGRDEGEKAGKGTDGKGYAGERRQRLSDTNPGSAGYLASRIYIFKTGMEMSGNPIIQDCNFIGQNNPALTML
jgi:hypothetical protein